MPKDPITSSDNRWLKRLRRAAERHQDEMVLEGPKQIADALERGLRPIAILVHESREAPRGADDRTTFHVADRPFRTIADTATSQGLVALFEQPRHELSSILDAPAPVVALDGVQDPGNVGAIVRLAAAFDLAGVVALSGTADPFSPRALRGSAGAALTTPVALVPHDAFLGECIRKGREIVAAMPGATPIGDVTLPRDAVLVLGSEGRGVADPIRDVATPVSIPTSARVESLNVAAAAAIIIWELARKR